MEILIISFRTLFFYFLVFMLYRVMGKREVGQLGIIDLIVSILIAELVAISIENYDKTIIYSIIPIVLLTLLQIILAFITLKKPKIRSFLDGNPSVIIKDGKINFHEMAKQKYNLEDLMIQLREKGAKSVDEVEYAILENNGKLSVFKYSFCKIPSYYPIPLILDGQVQQATLKDITKTEEWLKQLLQENELSIMDIFYAFYKNKKVYIIKRNDLT